MSDRSYSLDQIDAETGFGSRKIRYYIQELNVSNRGTTGRGARYPKATRDKLVFIRRLQDTVPSLRLGDIKSIVEATPDIDIAKVADGNEPLEIADVRSAEGARDFEIKTKTGNRRQKIVAVTLEGSEHVASGRTKTRFSKRRQAPEGRPDDWKVIKLDKDVELRVRGEYSSSKMKQLKLLGQLVKSILGSN